ncbi:MULTISPECIES: hypothetical protein [Acinetobacter]|jgi:hypothetical protein|uniref:Uncharacterized protein n=3 Tax=Acinetobacter schindleri TaxID=108981 RepID=N8Z726_9GAMM|nr:MULTISPECIES: hypothetical protein [Acinetobacter]APX62976.1 hypothetical protein AsACE_CH01579 [Acinetobacter schindleri]AWD68840.1 hypothetical protein C0119_00255 [Acinetobacter schindleri]EIM39911.1 hypothetical protein HADU_05410 [Acinetobacter sp. HA]ENV12832.1 hypothetical protein F965_02198 [Acinetobacter schindleri NIPH 900]ENV44892.1 hypothetical protein F955_01685 [Acinetobacter schindleri CIP 107287]
MNGYVTVLDSIPEESIAIAVYLIGSIIALLCWYGVTKRLPKPAGGFLWILVFAILLTPTVSEGPNASLAPAIFGLIFGVLTKEQELVWINASLILFVIGIASLIGYCWSSYVTNKAKIAVNKKTSPL